MRPAIVILLMLFASLAHGGTVYKYVDTHGKTVFSDQPPTKGKVVQTFEFADVPYNLPPPSQRNAANNKRTDTASAKAAVDTSRPVLFMAQWCGYCRQAKAYLSEKNISYQEIDIDTDSGKQAFSAQGGGGIPVLLRNGQKTRGFSRTTYDAAFRL